MYPEVDLLTLSFYLVSFYKQLLTFIIEFLETALFCSYWYEYCFASMDTVEQTSAGGACTQIRDGLALKGVKVTLFFFVRTLKITIRSLGQRF